MNFTSSGARSRLLQNALLSRIVALIITTTAKNGEDAMAEMQL
jgi:hypothetical protein